MPGTGPERLTTFPAVIDVAVTPTSVAPPLPPAGAPAPALLPPPEAAVPPDPAPPVEGDGLAVFSSADRGRRRTTIDLIAVSGSRPAVTPPSSADESPPRIARRRGRAREVIPGYARR